MPDTQTYPRSTLRNLSQALGQPQREISARLNVLGLEAIPEVPTTEETVELRQILHPQLQGPTIGADPEFEVYNASGAFINANQFFPVGAGSSHPPALGVDGANNTGELRPAPGHPMVVTYNISELLKQARDRLPEGYEIRAGNGTTVPTGGHIHFGPEFPVPTAIRMDSLDRLITEPLMARCSTRMRGRSQGYGTDPLDVRHQRGHGGFEVRRFPSWLSTPQLTQGALALAYEIGKMEETALKDIMAGDARNAIADRASFFNKPAIVAFYEYLSAGDHQLESINVLNEWLLGPMLERAAVEWTAEAGLTDLIQGERHSFLPGRRIQVAVSDSILTSGNESVRVVGQDADTLQGEIDRIIRSQFPHVPVEARFPERAEAQWCNADNGIMVIIGQRVLFKAMRQNAVMRELQAVIDLLAVPDSTQADSAAPVEGAAHV